MPKRIYAIILGVLILGIAIIGIQTASAAAACTDSDGGKNYSVQGTAQDNDQTKTDSCYMTAVGIQNSCSGQGCSLQEYYCGANNKVYVEIVASPYSCVKGVLKVNPSTDTAAPSKPTGLKTTVVSSTQIDLAWNHSTDNVGVAGYNVYCNGNWCGNGTIAALGVTFSSKNLSPGTKYTYQVDAFDAARYVSDKSSSVSATTAALTPIAPTGLKGIGNNTSLTWTWNASANAKSYRLLFYKESSCPGTYSQNPVTAATNKVITGLTANTPYSARILACADSSGNNCSSASACVSVKTSATQDTTRPSTPTGLIAIAVSPTQINLSWNPSTDNVGVAGYNVYCNGSWCGNGNIVTLGVSFLSKNLSPGTKYTYQVDAFDAAQNVSSKSSSVSATTPVEGVPGVISAPTASVERDSFSVKWTWNNVGTAYYNYLAYTNVNCSGSPKYENSKLYLSYKWNSVPIFASASLKVRACNASNKCSEFSQCVGSAGSIVPPPSENGIKIITPNGGEVWTAGKQQTITWQSGKNIKLVMISLYKGGKRIKYLTSKSSSSSGTKTGYWTPRNIPAGSDYKIKIEDWDSEVYDESDNTFSILTGSAMNNSSVLSFTSAISQLFQNIIDFLAK